MGFAMSSNVFYALLRSSHSPLIFLEIIFTVGTIDVGKARLMFWDLGGQEELQSLWDKVSLESNTNNPNQKS